MSSFYQGRYVFTDLDSGIPVTNDQFSWFVTTTSGFTALRDKSLTIDVSFNYFSSVVNGNSRQEDYNELDIFLRKQIWSKRGSITVWVSDIFNQSNLFNTRNFLNQNNTSLYRPENRLLTIGLRYKFGNVRIQSNKRSKGVEERNRL